MVTVGPCPALKTVVVRNENGLMMLLVYLFNPSLSSNQDELTLLHYSRPQPRRVHPWLACSSSLRR